MDVFQPDSTSVLSSIKYHVEFTPSFSPEKFELPKAYYQLQRVFEGRALLNAIGNLELTGPYADALTKIGCSLEDVTKQMGNPWKIVRNDISYPIKFYGKVIEGANGRKEWVGGEDITIVAYDVPIPGYKIKTTINLRLWSTKLATEAFDLRALMTKTTPKHMRLRKRLKRRGSLGVTDEVAALEIFSCKNARITLASSISIQLVIRLWREKGVQYNEIERCSKDNKVVEWTKEKGCQRWCKEILPNSRPVRGSEKLGSDVEVDSIGMNKFCPKGGGNTTIEKNLRNILTRMITRPTGGININSPMSQGGFSKEDMVKNQPKKELKFGRNASMPDPIPKDGGRGCGRSFFAKVPSPLVPNLREDDREGNDIPTKVPAPGDVPPNSRSIGGVIDRVITVLIGSSPNHVKKIGFPPSKLFMHSVKQDLKVRGFKSGVKYRETQLFLKTGAGFDAQNMGKFLLGSKIAVPREDNLSLSNIYLLTRMVSETLKSVNYSKTVSSISPSKESKVINKEEMRDRGALPADRDSGPVKDVHLMIDSLRKKLHAKN
ncbi:hypothetical protein BC332_02026 [Capsicum chinense]|nr:hypothetical protein BC332_02026 [Capsicum chinense]